MAYASKLPEKSYFKLSTKLDELALAAAKVLYTKKLSKARTKKQREACAGYYPTSWSELRKAWDNDDVPNITVRDCIRAGFVPVYIVPVIGARATS